MAPAVVALTLLAASAGSPADRATTAPGTATRLQSFGSCGEFLGYVKAQAMPLVQPWGLGSVATVGRGAPVPATALPSAAAAGDARESVAPTVEFSTTNVQEEGVDEPDMVKSNGSYLFVLQGNAVRAVDVRARKPRLAGSLELATTAYGAELLLYGNRLLVLSRGGGWIEPLPAAARMIYPYVPSKSVLTEVDVSNPEAMKVVRSLTLEDSSYVSARLVGSTARIVASSSMPHEIPFAAPTAGTPDATASALARNREVVSSSRVAKWLPSYTLKKRGAKAAPERSLVQCRDVYRPASFSGLGLLTVLTVDLSKGLEPVDSNSIVTDGRIVYASPESLYVATERWADRPLPATPTDAPAAVTTAIHKFDISDPAKTVYRGSGQVSGFLLNQWSLSEYGGVLRVASTEAPAWWSGVQPESESFVTTLREREGKLVTIGRVGELGRGERIYAVRFVGDVGYVVTFRQVDPLYTLDLSDPSHPAVLGELKIEGYSAYLHPVGDDLILGLGQDASEEGRVRGTQLSLFDVSNLRKPVRLHQKVIGPGSSEAEYDHHAFLYWPKTGLVTVPVQTYSAEPGIAEAPFVGAIGFRVGRKLGIEELGRVTHGATEAGSYPIRRSLVVDDALYTVSDLGVGASSLTTFAEIGWAGFPVPKPIVEGGGVTGGAAPSAAR
ncbi:MAG TPA: beta-propeller domain-containing protein [Gaiellaceae bacterium]